MAYESSGPWLPHDVAGRTVVDGYVISGDEISGFRGRALLGLTLTEALYGCCELVYAQTLPDLLVEIRAQLILRSMVGEAARDTGRAMDD